MAVNGDTLYAINRFSHSINSYDITEEHSTALTVCDEKCPAHISNPFDLSYDSASGDLFVLDGDAHPTLPTYSYSIKRVQVSTNEKKTDNSEIDISKMLKFYSDWFASINKD